MSNNTTENTNVNDASSLKVADLKKILDAQKVAYPKTAKKAELVELVNANQPKAEEPKEKATEEKVVTVEEQARRDGMALIDAMLKEGGHRKGDIAKAAHAICPETLNAGKTLRLYWVKAVRRRHRALEAKGEKVSYIVGRSKLYNPHTHTEVKIATVKYRKNKKAQTEQAS